MIISDQVFKHLNTIAKKVSTMVFRGDTFGGSRSRFDDNVGGNVIDDVATMLRTNPEFKKWYIQLQRRVSDESNIEEKRKLELKLLYPFKAYSSTLKGKVKSDWEGQLNTYRSSQFNPNTEDPGSSDQDYTGMSLSGGQLSDEYVDDDSRIQLTKVGKDQAYRYSRESIGSRLSAGRNPAEAVQTSNVMSKVIKELRNDDKSLAVFLALLTRWNINLPTYIRDPEVPELWWTMQKDASAQGSKVKATRNLRKFLSNYGVKNYRETSNEMTVIKKALLRVTNSKTQRELAAILNSPQNYSSGSHGSQGIGTKDRGDTLPSEVVGIAIDESFSPEELERNLSDQFTKIVMLTNVMDTADTINESNQVNNLNALDVSMRSFARMLATPMVD